MPIEATLPPVTLVAGCKINLSLEITGRREDGYHFLESVFWPLRYPVDTLHVTCTSQDGIRLECSDPALETSDNILIKAYNAFSEATSFSPGLSVFLQKNIPYGAGLGGGSSDAAALLLYCNRLAQTENAPSLSAEKLSQLGARLGADVPFFLHNVPCLIRGIGDIIEPLPSRVVCSFSGLHLVLVCPKIHVATAWAFSAWDKKDHSDTLTNRHEKDSSPLVHGVRIRNDLCRTVFDHYPELKKDLSILQNVFQHIFPEIPEKLQNQLQDS